MSGLRSDVTVSTDHGRGYCPIKGKNVPSRVGVGELREREGEREGVSERERGREGVKFANKREKKRAI